MQLNVNAPLRLALAAATAQLLAPGAAQAQSTPARPAAPAASAPATPPAADAPWIVDTALLYYAENGGRVKALEPMVAVRRTDGNDRTLSLKLTLDTLTGASPYGAVAQPGPQTFTSPSGRGTHTSPAGQIPLDPSFKDKRVALAAGWEQPWGADRRLALGANVSGEHDFFSLSGSVAVSQDFNQKNTTGSLGLSYERDQIKPEGGAPQGLRTAWDPAWPKSGSESRGVTDLLIGLTQVMSRTWVTQLNLNLGQGSGYHTDPYKLLSVVDGNGLLTGDRYVHEKRPDSRRRTSLYWQHKLAIGEAVLDASWRHYRDDWGIRANTFDARWRQPVGGGWYVEPQWREYRQSAADFYRVWLNEGGDWNSTTHAAALPYASSDPRLGAFRARTLGLKLGVVTGTDREVSLRLSRYVQTLDQPANPPGVLQTVDLTPDLKATTLMLAWRFPLSF